MMYLESGHHAQSIVRALQKIIDPPSLSENFTIAPLINKHLSELDNKTTLKEWYDQNWTNFILEVAHFNSVCNKTNF